MKKALLIAVSLIVMVASTCNKQPGPETQNSDKGKKPATTPDTITITYNVTLDADHNIVVTENCKGCTSATPTVKVGGTLNWNVTSSGFASPEPIVTISDFKTVRTSGGGDWSYQAPSQGTDIFTPQPSTPPPFSSPFVFKQGDASKASNPKTADTYKYSVIIKWTDNGNPRQITFDPRVVFDP